MAASKRLPISDHCDGRRFYNPRFHINRTWLDVLKWRRQSTPTPWPTQVEIPPQTPQPTPQDGTIRVTWINHSSILIQTRHGNLLIDPVFSDRVSPFSWAGPKRVHPPGIKLRDLPTIDAILLSHDHYDHCDKATLRHLAETFPQAQLICPLGNGTIAQRCGFNSSRTLELDWWDGPRSHRRLSHPSHPCATLEQPDPGPSQRTPLERILHPCWRSHGLLHRRHRLG